jgi:hypothetical protein
MSPEYILETAFAFRKSKALLTAVELDVFDVLADGPQSVVQLVGLLRVHGRGLRDLLDALVALELLERDAGGRYSNAPASAVYLDRRQPGYIGGLLAYLNARVYRTWGHLTEALVQGKPQGGPAGAGGFADFYADVSALNLFLEGMSGGSRAAARALAAKFPWAAYRTVIDVGTAQGCVPVELAMAHPHLTGGGFDLPQLQPAFEHHVRKHGLDNRLKFHPGNFFKQRLPQADVLVMGRVLHDWDIPTRKLLLKKAYEALPSGGALVVHEMFIDDARRKRVNSMLASLNMLLQTDGGSESTEAECVTWMAEAGYGDIDVVPLAGGHTAIVGKKCISATTSVIAPASAS